MVIPELAVPSLLFPWALAALGLLPALWRLLKILPPAPRRQSFPAIRFLAGLSPPRPQAVRSPWWLILLRMTILALAILGAAHPVMHVKPGRILPHLILVMDDDWAAAPDWAARIQAAQDQIQTAQTQGQNVVLLTTSPDMDATPPRILGPMPADQARARILSLTPKPWASDQKAALAALRELPETVQGPAVWISDGLDQGGAALDLMQGLQGLGDGLTILRGAPAPILLPQGGDGRVRIHSHRPLTVPLTLRGLDRDGRVLGLLSVDKAGPAHLDLPAGLAARIERLDLEEQGPAAIVLNDAADIPPLIGVIAPEQNAAPLLHGAHYLEQALRTRPIRGDAEQVLRADPGMILLPDGTDAAPFAGWLDKGGVLVRFAGPDLAQRGQTDPLLPVPLKAGGRNLGGTMTWEKAQSVAAPPATSPLAGLVVPQDMQVRGQVLAEPGPLTAQAGWLFLADGTPLVTGRRSGQGWLVLVHTALDPDWSNLAVSALLPRLLHRLSHLPQHVPQNRQDPQQMRVPQAVLDGFGRLTPPSATILPLPDSAGISPGPRHPPGLYGTGADQIALNLGPALAAMDLAPLPTLPGVTLASLTGHAPARDLRGLVWGVAALLLVVDGGILAVMSGMIRRRIPVAILAPLLLLAAPPTQAMEQSLLQASLNPRLMWIKSGDSATDAKTNAGLTALTRHVRARTTVALADPMAVDPDSPTVMASVLLYWQIPAHHTAPLPPQAVRNLNAFLKNGGLLVIDMPGGMPLARQILAGLALPPLRPADGDHALGRAFYLLKTFPGQRDADTVWVAGNRSLGLDDVSPVVLGSHDWAGAWASPPDTPQPYRRDLAFRFGVNLVMLALTGNYKSDQVHLPAIMERLGK